jgi:hypothetical protein
MAINFPASPTAGQTFTSGGKTWKWSTAASAWQGNTDGGTTTIVVSDTPPSSPVNGSVWWNSTEGALKVYYTDGTSNQWVDANPAIQGPVGPQGATGAAGANGVGVPIAKTIAIAMVFG